MIIIIVIISSVLAIISSIFKKNISVLSRGPWSEQRYGRFCRMVGIMIAITMYSNPVEILTTVPTPQALLSWKSTPPASEMRKPSDSAMTACPQHPSPPLEETFIVGLRV